VSDTVRSLLWWVAAAALIVVAVVSADWGSGGPAPPPAQARAARQVTSAREVQEMDLTPRDVPAGFLEVTPRSASDLDPGDRLDLCGIPEPPEDRSLAPDRRAYVAANGQRVRTEVVAYRRYGADRALASLQALAATCARPVPPGRGEQPATLAMRVRSPNRLPRGMSEQLLVERRGNVLVVLQVDAPPGPLALDLARLVSLRLETRLPDR
jgi:hypothetical protein